MRSPLVDGRAGSVTDGNQLSLALDTPRTAVYRSRRNDPETCKRGPAPGTLLARVADCLLTQGPATDWEILVRLGLPERKRGSVAKRRQDTGAIDTGQRRPSPDGHPCVVWTLTTTKEN